MSRSPLSPAEFARSVRALLARVDEDVPACRADRGPVVVATAAFLLDHPHESANAAARYLPFRRQDVLWAVQTLREAHTRFRKPGNHGASEGGDPPERT
jgi:hypothetical protein